MRDIRWPVLYRVYMAGGYRTDLVNLSRAKDAARALALAELNRREAA
jgi:hypothetical protein